MNTDQYYNWKQAIDARVPENMRVGSNLMIVTDAAFQDSLSSPRVVDVCTLILQDKGESTMLIDMKQYKMKAPCLSVIMPDKIYQLLDKSEDVSFRAIVMSKEFTDNLFRYQGNPEELRRLVDDNPVLDLGNDLVSFNTFYRILLLNINSPVKAFRLQSAKHLIISLLYHYVRKIRHSAAVSSKEERIYSKFCEDVRMFYKTNRTLPFYAGRLGIGTNLLTRIVKEKYGRTAAEYIDDITIIECKALLSSTEMSVQQISRALNFTSQSVFGKFFNRMTGISPSEYRREYR